MKVEAGDPQHQRQWRRSQCQIQGNLEPRKHTQMSSQGGTREMHKYCDPNREGPVEPENTISSGSHDAVTEAPLIGLLVDDHGILHVISWPG